MAYWYFANEHANTASLLNSQKRQSILCFCAACQNIVFQEYLPEVWSARGDLQRATEALNRRRTGREKVLWCGLLPSARDFDCSTIFDIAQRLPAASPPKITNHIQTLSFGSATLAWGCPQRSCSRHLVLPSFWERQNECSTYSNCPL